MAPKLRLNPNEMAFRKIYWPLVRDGSLTTIFRPGKRFTPEERGYQVGQLVTARIIEKVGSDWVGIPPYFALGRSRQIKILSVAVKRVSDLTEWDFEGSSPDVHDIHSLIYQLGVIYNLYPEEINEEVGVVTITKFAYMSMQEGEKNITSASELVRSGVLSFAKMPKDNPDSCDFPSYVLPLIEHDYPAKTPVMWNAAYRKFGVQTRAVMLVGNPSDAPRILEVFQKDPAYIGGGAGVGFKDEVVKYIELDPMAEAIGAINFVLKTPEGRLRGFNTDGLGYAMSLENLFGSLSGSRIVILGAGGTGNSVAFALAGKGANVVILNRTAEKAKELAERINRFERREAATFGGEDQIEQVVLDADVVVNVSTKGAVGEMEKYSSLASARLPATTENVETNLAKAAAVLDRMKSATIVSDIVLTEKVTPLLDAAKQKNFRTLDGVPMVINQGVEAFWILHHEDLSRNGFSKTDVAAVMTEAANG